MGKFVVIGERIHCISPCYPHRLWTSSDPEPILKRAAEQLDCQAPPTWTSTSVLLRRTVPSACMWAVKLLQENFDNVPLALDTANKRAIEAGIKVYNRTERQAHRQLRRCRFPYFQH